MNDIHVGNRITFWFGRGDRRSQRTGTVTEQSDRQISIEVDDSEYVFTITAGQLRRDPTKIVKCWEQV